MENKYVVILSDLEKVKFWEWVDIPPPPFRALKLFTAQKLFTVWADDGRERSMPSVIKAFSPEVEAGFANHAGAGQHTGRPVNVFWPIESGALSATGATLCAFSPSASFLAVRTLTAAEKDMLAERAGPDEVEVFKKADIPKAVEYAFLRDGDYWNIVFEGNKIPAIQHVAGMTYLHAMLSHPGHPDDALALYRLENLPPPEVVTPINGEELDPAARKQYGTGGATQKVFDPQAIAEIRKVLAERKDELSDTLLLEKRGRLEEEIETLEKFLEDSTVAFASGGPTFEPKAEKGPRQAVAGAIDRAIDKIAKIQNGGNLAKHLRGAVLKGKALSYAGGLTWQT